jgi:ABC-type dipeptide/oligopeptide/nickel transport system permease subunit
VTFDPDLKMLLGFNVLGDDLRDARDPRLRMLGR